MLVRWASPILLASAMVAEAKVFSFLPKDLESGPRNETKSFYKRQQLFDATLDAVRVMQDSYFEPWVGTWPKAIDWTAAVMGSHLAGALTSLSRGLGTKQDKDYQQRENLISTYFSQLISFYFGQNALSLRLQAFDDILWVVLNWLDTLQFINEYTANRPTLPKQLVDSVGQQLPKWYGNVWVPAFAHRARIFWELGLVGWDEKYCGGGMNWNPHTRLPYKNAITNELFIAASAGMFMHFPGDTNPSPYGFEKPSHEPIPDKKSDQWPAKDPKYFTYAHKAYLWLFNSGMTNDKGLFTDGFHITDWPHKTKCDERSEMVYTYNQGVILSGLRELYRATGNKGYLRQGHQLIQNVIRATGWNLAEDKPTDDLSHLQPGELPAWRGLGRAGILEEVCDPSGKCSQNAHTFKGIFMHHFTAFCAPLDIAASNKYPHDIPEYQDEDGTVVTPQDIRTSHTEACQRYKPWISHNAHAAMRTRTKEGKIGMWWTAGLLDLTNENLKFDYGSQPGPAPEEVPGMLFLNFDYRNYGVPQVALKTVTVTGTGAGEPHASGFGSNSTVGGSDSDNGEKVTRPAPAPAYEMPGVLSKEDTEKDQILDVASSVNQHRLVGILDKAKRREAMAGPAAAGPGSASDPNERYRGRTVETQGSGLAVIRALWELENQES
ncbi:glycosyl hydrolase [Naviculisporaceae sp. PSN 640]